MHADMLGEARLARRPKRSVVPTGYEIRANHSEWSDSVLRIPADRGQFRRDVQARHPDSIIRHSVIDIETIRRAEIVPAIDAGGKHDAVNRAVEFQSAFWHEQRTVRMMDDSVRTFW